MARFRKRPVIVDAVQWWKVTYDKEAGHGNEPEDMPICHSGVGYYRTPCLDGQDKCKECGDIMHNHGWIDTLEDGHIVCPGDWIITGVKNEQYPCKNEIFKETYEAVSDGEI